MRKTLIYLIAGLFINGVFANEPGWSEKQRAETRDIVLIGEVLKTEKPEGAKDNKWTEIWKSEIKVSGIEKGPKELNGKTIPLYFERGTIIKGTKIRNKRCPKCADLEVGKRYKFFIVEIKPPHTERLGINSKDGSAYMIQMGSDAILDANLTGSQLTIKQGVDKSTHIFRGVKLDDSGPGKCSEKGVLCYLGNFSIKQMLQGNPLAKKAVNLSYIVLEFKPRYERAIEKNEKVIVFMKDQEAIKLLPDTKENLKKLELLVQKEKANNLTGSNLTVKQAFQKSTHIFRGLKTNGPGIVICDEAGVLIYLGSFTITEMLYGDKLAKKEIRLSYTVLEFKPKDERPIEKNEKVIVFMNKNQAIKILPDNEENIKKIKALTKTTK